MLSAKTSHALILSVVGVLLECCWTGTEERIHPSTTKNKIQKNTVVKGKNEELVMISVKLVDRKIAALYLAFAYTGIVALFLGASAVAMVRFSMG